MEVVMKTLLILTVIFILALSIPVHAQETGLPAGLNKSLVEDNLLKGLSTENTGLQRSCALLLGRIKSDRGVIQLMDALHSNTNPSVRIAAAWALCRIGDSRGVYAVKMAVRFDESPKVQSTCAWYYENFVEQGSFMFLQPDPASVADME
jgi:hypothetical protein